MNNKFSIFQAVVIALCIFFGIVGLVVFAGFGGVGKTTIPSATIWGTLPAANINEVVRVLNQDKQVIDLTYIEKDSTTFAKELVNAIAEGKGPDAVLIPDDLVYSQSEKIQLIPFSSFSERQFRDTYIDASSILVSSNGILGIPYEVDPLVMYWNKSIFQTAGISGAPKTWSEVGDDVSRVILKTDKSTINRALLPMGEYKNVKNAKAILSSLFFQAGNPITEYDAAEQRIKSTLDATVGGINTAESVIKFYTAFSNPLNANYTWNRSLGNSETEFLAGNLGLYFGFASELPALQRKNPNLNFDVSLIPQIGGKNSVVNGRIYVFSLIKQSKNTSGALSVISYLIGKDANKYFSDLENLPTGRRDLLGEKASNSYMEVFNKAAIQTRVWNDANPEATNSILQDMIESYTSGRSSLGDAISTAKQRMDILLRAGGLDI